MSYSPSSNSSRTSANTVICCLWKVKWKSSDTYSTSVWLTLTPANQSAIEAVSQWVNHQPTIQQTGKQTEKTSCRPKPASCSRVCGADATCTMKAHYSTVQSKVNYLQNSVEFLLSFIQSHQMCGRASKGNPVAFCDLRLWGCTKAFLPSFARLLYKTSNKTEAHRNTLKIQWTNSSLALHSSGLQTGTRMTVNVSIGAVKASG